MRQRKIKEEGGRAVALAANKEAGGERVAAEKLVAMELSAEKKVRRNFLRLPSF